MFDNFEQLVRILPVFIRKHHAYIDSIA